CLKVKGDSMIGARINDGDIVFIREQPCVENGEIAAVMIDNEVTLKRFYKNGGLVMLRSENPKYQPLMYTKEDFKQVRILGKAIFFQSKL
ncbi:MAG TPA: S24 family peptidase, partial [Tissierellaceae bacterium]|nr:S24 family peptidase [Tissierellaceae bacterium]